MVAHAKRDHPDEACGIIAGPEGSDRPERFIPMLNAAGSPTFYEFDSGELLTLYKEMWAAVRILSHRGGFGDQRKRPLQRLVNNPASTET